MTCPHCQSPVIVTSSACAQCGLADSALAQILGSDWVRLDRITDNARRLSLSETSLMETRLDDFERSFPQCFMAVYLGPLPAPLTVTDLGFWLLNHGAFHTQSIAKRNDFGITLVIDPLQMTVGISVGYALENLLPVSFLASVLRKCRSSLRKGLWPIVVQRTLILVSKELRKRATQVTGQFDESPPPLGDAGKLGFEPLRPTLRLENSIKDRPHA